MTDKSFTGYGNFCSARMTATATGAVIWPMYENDIENDCVAAACGHAMMVLYPGFVPSDAAIRKAYRVCGLSTRKQMWYNLVFGLNGKRFWSFGTREKTKASITTDLKRYKVLVADLDISHTVMLLRADDTSVTYVSLGVEETHPWDYFLDLLSGSTLTNTSRVWGVSKRFDLSLIAGAFVNNKLWWFITGVSAVLTAAAFHAWTYL